MEKRKLQTVTPGKLFLGTWAIGGRNWGSYSEKDAVRALETSIEKGVQSIDTSPVYGYGHAEKLIGKVMGGRRSKLFLATKGGLDSKHFFAKDLSASFLREELHGSLKRLNTDYIDLYQCHWPDPQTPLEETMETLMALRDAGKIVHIGLCNFPPHLIHEARQYGEIFSHQDHLSLLEQGALEKTIVPAAAYGIKSLVYGVLEGGLLSGKYTSMPVFGKKDVRSTFYTHYREAEWPGIEKLIAVLKETAEKYNATPSAIAIAWALKSRGVSSVIVGSRSEKQCLENIAALDISLSEKECSSLTRLASRFYG